MALDWKKIGLALAILVFLIAGWTVAHSLLTKNAPAQPGAGNTGTFGTASNQPTGTTAGGSTANTNQGISYTAQAPGQRVFKLSDGPVAGATFIETRNPTTTVARYVMQDTGHVFDLPVGVAGAVPRPVSNTTIPGIERVVWTEKGSGVILQYLEGAAIKTVSIEFPKGTSTPMHLRFLPDNILSIAASPDGKNLAYLLAGGDGSSGYIAAADGTGSKKLFSLPLSQVRLSWPAPEALLVETRPAAGIPGMAFSVGTKTGTVSPLVYAPGLSATANGDFTKVMYSTISADAAKTSTYAHDVASGLDTPLLFNPIPEKCLWSTTKNAVLYCAAPTSYTPGNYLDLWHQGLAGVGDGIFAFNTQTGTSQVVATPGLNDSGISSDMYQLALSPDERYLSFINKGDRSLWSVLLTQ